MADEEDHVPMATHWTSATTVAATSVQLPDEVCFHVLR
jgi:hypothetical protein